MSLELPCAAAAAGRRGAHRRTRNLPSSDGDPEVPGGCCGCCLLLMYSERCRSGVIFSCPLRRSSHKAVGWDRVVCVCCSDGGRRKCVSIKFLISDVRLFIIMFRKQIIKFNVLKTNRKYLTECFGCQRTGTYVNMICMCCVSRKLYESK